LEAGHEHQLAFLVADLVPRDPDAVGISQLRLALVLDHLFGGEDELAFRHGVDGIVVGGIEGIDGQGAVDDHGFGVHVAEEGEPSAKPSHARFVCLVEDRIGPDIEHPRGHLGLRLGAGKVVVGQVEAGAASHQQRQGADVDEQANDPGHGHAVR
jgi:hypothetical protein